MLNIKKQNAIIIPIIAINDMLMYTFVYILYSSMGFVKLSFGNLLSI